LGGPHHRTARLDFFFSFRSPYSYLAAPRAFALPERFDLQVVFRGVIPMAMRGQSVPRQKRLHTLRDVKHAVRLDMPFGHIHDPIGAGALRCLVIAQHAREVGREREFVLGASRGIWAEAADVARDADLRPICEHAGLDWQACSAALRNPEMRARVDADTAALAASGHWGVPLFDFRGELFWGQDRIEDLEVTLGEAGLGRAASTSSEVGVPPPPRTG
jgi:2-hydroxychromene-2-carboxylate isomerase